MKGIVALTGATGFVGAAALTQLLDAGYSVRALTRREQQQRAGVDWIEGSLDRPESLNKLCDGADAVLHIAGVVNAPNPQGFEEGNVTGTQNILDAARDRGVRRFIHVSSLAAREPGLSAYGRSKFRAEKLVATSLLDWTVIRPPGVYGPGDSDGLELFKMAKRGFVLLPPKGWASWIHVEDLARLLVALIPSSEAVTARIFEADDGAEDGWSHRSYGRAIGWALGKPVTAISIPAPLLKLAAMSDRTVRRANARLTPDRASYMIHPDWTIDTAMRPPAQLWQPAIATRQGLKDTARWYKAQGWL